MTRPVREPTNWADAPPVGIGLLDATVLAVGEKVGDAVAVILPPPGMN